MATAVLRASACCIEIHKQLHNFDTGVDGVRLCLHIGVGCGEVTILQVGGAVPPETHVPRFEYIIAGPPLEQISIAEPLAKNGETCLSPQAWEYVRDCVIEDASRQLEGREEFHLLLKMDETKYTFPTIKHAAMERDRRHETQFKLSELNVIRRYIPSAVFKQIEGGTLTYVNEMRNISTIFIGGSGVDVSADDGALVAHNLMNSVQEICYAHEGTLNKFVIDDKGMLFLLVYGLPPLVHTDDPTRAVLSCFEMVKVFQKYDLTGKFGVTTGRAYCGVCGSARRMEYTVLGDAVNLSARLMASAPAHGILIDQTTKGLCSREIVVEELPPIKVKGKTQAIPIFVPHAKGPPDFIGLDPAGKVRFPWYDRPLSMSQQALQKEDEMAKALKENVAQLCSLQNWEGITKVQSLLGGRYDADLHLGLARLPSNQPQGKSSSAPESSPFATGGVVVIEGDSGMGKIELAEHMVLYAGVELGMLPIFGTIGPRVSDLDRMGLELLRSTVGVFRHLDPSLPSDDLEALKQILPSHLQDAMPQVQQAFDRKGDEEECRDLLMALVELVASLLEIVRKRTSVLIVLQLEYGTCLFPKTIESFSPFWSVVTTLARVAMPENGVGGGDRPVVMTLLVKEADHSHTIVRQVAQKGWFIELKELSEANCVDYVAMYLQAPSQMVSSTLQKFIAKVSLGNPLYMRETIDQLLKSECIQVSRDAGGTVESVRHLPDLESINIASWGQTAMVGNTICLLESLDPLQAAVLKMSTCFSGAFTLPDLAASGCSSWAGATHFDFLRLFRAIEDLVNRGIILEGPAPSRAPVQIDSSPGGSSIAGQNQLQTFEMKNVLIRKVGGAMVLEAQKKVVKRQALVDRRLSRDLPARMEEVRTKRLEPHIPWYYENVLVKGPS